MSAAAARMFGNAGAQAVDSSIRAFGRRQGLPDEKVRSIIDTLGKTVIQAGAALSLDSAQLRHVSDELLSHLIEVHSGRIDDTKIAQLDRECFEDQRSLNGGIGGVEKTKRLFRDLAVWLRDQHPALNQALADSHGFGHHRVIVRHLVDAFHREKAEGARTARAGKFFRGAASVLPDPGSAGAIGDG